MKLKNWLLAFYVLSCFVCSAQKNIIELPLKLQNGFGPFGLGLKVMSAYRNDENNPWIKTYLKISGFPKNLIDVKLGDIDINMFQNVYQNYLSGNISGKWYESLQK